MFKLTICFANLSRGLRPHVPLNPDEFMHDIDTVTIMHMRKDRVCILCCVLIVTK